MAITNLSPTGSGRVARGTPRLSPKQFLGYGAGDTAYNLTFALTFSFLAMYYTDVAGISPAVVGAIFLGMRFIDAFTDILIGSLIDRTSTRFGKFRPYILLGSIPLILTTILAFSMPTSLHGTGGAIVWATVTYFLMGSVFGTIVNIPYGSLASAMTDNRDERATLAVFRTTGAMVMKVVTTMAVTPIIEANQGDPDALQSALTWTIGVLGILAFGLYLFLFLTSTENVERIVPKVGLADAVRTLKANRALQMLGVSSVTYLVGMFAASGIMVYYFRDIVGDARLMTVFSIMTGGAILIFGWAIPRMIRRFGKPRMFQFGALAGATGAIVLSLAPADTAWLSMAGVVPIGFSMALVNSLMWNLEADTVDYGEWRTGLRTEGTSYAVFSFMRKLAQALGGALGVWIIGWFGYHGGADVQSDTAQTGIRVAVGVLPALCYTVSAVLMHFYPLTEARFRSVQEELDERGEKESAAAAGAVPSDGHREHR